MAVRQEREVIMPTASVGLCRVQRCWEHGDLAEGLCVKHWDRGLDRQDPHSKYDNKDTDVVE
jgi:hypothetical protein